MFLETLLHFFAPPYTPFAIAGTMVVGLSILEGALLFVGMSLSGLGDHGADVGHDVDHAHGLHFGDHADGFHFLNVGKLPLLAIILILCTLFSIAGFSIQFAAESMKVLLTNFIAVPLASAIALGVAHPLTSLWVRFFPAIDNYAIGRDELIGLVGYVLDGTGNRHNPVQVKVKDRFGNSHYIMVVPVSDKDTFVEGELIRISSREDANLFGATRPPEDTTG